MIVCTGAVSKTGWSTDCSPRVGRSVNSRACRTFRLDNHLLSADRRLAAELMVEYRPARRYHTLRATVATFTPYEP